MHGCFTLPETQLAAGFNELGHTAATVEFNESLITAVVDAGLLQERGGSFHMADELQMREGIGHEIPRG
jgi:hypothetical protein